MTDHAPLRRGARCVAAIALLAAAACVDSTTAPAPRAGPPLLDAGVATPACDAAVFGPAVFTRTAGPPTTSSETFAAPAAGDFYRLEASDHGAGNATVRLNGVEIVTSHDLSAAHGSVTRHVVLAEHNVLEVRQAGKPGSQLSIRIVDPRTAASVRITPATVLLMEVRENVRYTAEVFDAQGRPMTRCVEWSSSDPEVATVAADGSVHAVAIGTTQLIARVDGAATHLPITVVQRTGPNQGTGYVGYCAMNQPDATVPLACFDAIVQTSALDGGQTLIELSLRNRQGSQGGESLPASILISVMVFDGSGAGPSPLRQLGFGAVGWSQSTSGPVEVVGSQVVPVGTGHISFPPFPGGPTFQGTSISQFALLGCASPTSFTPSAYWRTCGDHAGTVDYAFVSPGTWTAANLILYLSFNIDPLGVSQPACTTTRPPGTLAFPWAVCRQRLPPL